jgi:hypothetical protein
LCIEVHEESECIEDPTDETGDERADFDGGCREEHAGQEDEECTDQKDRQRVEAEGGEDRASERDVKGSVVGQGVVGGRDIGDAERKNGPLSWFLKKR